MPFSNSQSCLKQIFASTTQALILASIGTFDAKKRTGNNIYPGWILFKKKQDVPTKQQLNEEEAHDRLARSHFKVPVEELKTNFKVLYGYFRIEAGRAIYD